MDAAADVALSDPSTPCPTPGAVLTEGLAEYPATLLWGELRERLPLDAAAQVYEAAATAVRAARE